MRQTGAVALVVCLWAAAQAHARQFVLPLWVDGAGLERFADAVSDPSSPRFGRYASIEWLSHRFGASSATRRRVITYLHHHGASDIDIDATGLFASATLPPRGVRPARIRRALPGAVTGVLGLPVPVPLAASAAHAASARRRTGTPAGCPGALASGGFTPNQYLTVFDYSPLQNAGDQGQGQRVALLEADGIDSGAVDAFAHCFALPVPPVTMHLVGLRHALAPGGETTLDLEVLDAAAPRLSGIDVYETSFTDAAFLKSLAAPLQKRAHTPQVISISLGDCEANVQRLVSNRGFSHAELALAEDVAAGITVVAATGDSGSTGCQKSSNLLPEDVAAVVFPASSPHVIAVGGTNITLTSDNALANEIVWNEAPHTAGAGGGGCSTLFARPAYQRGLPVSTCGAVERVHGRSVSVPMRAMPDVAMLADGSPGYAIYCPKRLCGAPDPWQEVGGTSAAAPLLAGGLALVDQSLRSSGHAPLGEALPLMYRSPGAFDDVLSGDNDLAPFLPGSGGRGVGCCTAHRGYDLASGLGSIDLARLAAAASRTLPHG